MSSYAGKWFKLFISLHQTKNCNSIITGNYTNTLLRTKINFNGEKTRERSQHLHTDSNTEVHKIVLKYERKSYSFCLP